MRLLAAGTGRAIFSHELEAGELPLVARGVHLIDKTAGGKSRPLIAVGTSFSAGAASISRTQPPLLLIADLQALHCRVDIVTSHD